MAGSIQLNKWTIRNMRDNNKLLFWATAFGVGGHYLAVNNHKKLICKILLYQLQPSPPPPTHPTSANNSLTSAGCPIIQLKFDTIYLEMASDLTVLQGCTLTHMSVTGPGCCLCFWWIGYRSKFPLTLSLGLVNLLEWLTEVRETFYLIDWQFIIKG